MKGAASFDMHCELQDSQILGERGRGRERERENTITYNAGISACEKAGELARALQLVDGMANSRVETDTITYNAAISACEKAALSSDPHRSASFRSAVR